MLLGLLCSEMGQSDKHVDKCCPFQVVLIFKYLFLAPMALETS